MLICSPIALPPSSSKKGTVHPPNANPPCGSSSGPPGACMTPSSDTNVNTTIFLIRALFPRPGSASYPSSVPTVLAWLLDSDPTIRWQVLRDLTDAPADEVGAERARVATEG